MQNMSPRESYDFTCERVTEHMVAVEDLIGTLAVADQLDVLRGIKKSLDKLEKPSSDAVRASYGPIAGVGAVAFRQEQDGNVGWKAVAEKLAETAKVELSEEFLAAFRGKSFFKAMVEDVPDFDTLLGLETWAVLDFETTGVTNADRIVEVGLVLYHRPTGEIATYHSYVNPEGRASAPEAQAVHQIAEETLSTAPKWSEVEPELRARLRGALLVAQNIEFEKRFLQIHDFTPNWVGELDTKVLGQITVSGLKSYSLGPLAEALGVAGRAGDAHGALEDARITLGVLQALVARRGS